GLLILVLILCLVLSLRGLPGAGRRRVAILRSAEQRLENIDWTLRHADCLGAARPMRNPPLNIARLRLRLRLGLIFGVFSGLLRFPLRRLCALRTRRQFRRGYFSAFDGNAHVGGFGRRRLLGLRIGIDGVGWKRRDLRLFRGRRSRRRFDRGGFGGSRRRFRRRVGQVAQAVQLVGTLERRAYQELPRLRVI